MPQKDEIAIQPDSSLRRNQYDSNASDASSRYRYLNADAIENKQYVSTKHYKNSNDMRYADVGDNTSRYRQREQLLNAAVENKNEFLSDNPSWTEEEAHPGPINFSEVSASPPQRDIQSYQNKNGAAGDYKSSLHRDIEPYDKHLKLSGKDTINRFYFFIIFFFIYFYVP